MTTQESSTRRGGARAAAAEAWVAEPDVSDETIRASTGRGWDEWVALIDAGPGRDAGHTAVAAWLVDRHGVPGWWAQSVTVGYERIAGLRVPGQRPDGTFTVSRSRVLDLDRDRLRALLDDDAGRADLVPGLTLVPRSRPGVRSPRFGVRDDDGEHGVVMFALDPAGSRLRMTVSHERLASAAAAETWKAFWAHWLAGLPEI